MEKDALKKQEMDEYIKNQISQNVDITIDGADLQGYNTVPAALGQNTGSQES